MLTTSHNLKRREYFRDYSHDDIKVSSWGVLCILATDMVSISNGLP